MTNLYRLARAWRAILIVCSAGLVLIPIGLAVASPRDSALVPVVLLFIGLAALSCGALFSRIIISPSGIEYRLLGTRATAAWDKVDRIDLNPFGFINLMCREPIYQGQIVNFLLRPLGYNRTIQLSPYIDDLGTSPLLLDLAQYLPNSSIRELMAAHRRSEKPFHKVGFIGLYYLGWLFLLLGITGGLRTGAAYLEGLGWLNATLISDLVEASLILALLFNGLGLISYNARIASLDSEGISHVARALYLYPLLVLLLSLVMAWVIWAVLRLASIVLVEEDYGLFSLVVGCLLAAVSLRLSSKVERLVFRGLNL